MEGKFEIPIEEFSLLNLQKDIQISVLMKQNNELQRQNADLQQLLNSITASAAPAQPTSVQPEQV